MSPDAPSAGEVRPTVWVFYDYICPYAFVGHLRAQRLAEEFDVAWRWLPWEIYPTTVPAGEPYEGDAYPDELPDWVDDLAGEFDAELKSPDMGINSNLALRGAEYAKDQGPDRFEAYHRAAFDAVWRDGLNIGEEKVLRDLAQKADLDPDRFMEGIRHQAYQERLDEVDRFATRLGIQRVPTFVFGDQRIVGNDPFEASLRAPLEAFLERWKAFGPEWTTTVAEDTGLDGILL